MPDDQRQSAHEQFVIVNHAYEVLIDNQNRQLYDQFGVWPPPSERQASKAGNSRHQSTKDRSDQSDRRDYSRRSADFAFTDPFELFDRLMNDLTRWPEADAFFTPFGTRRSSRVQRLDPFAPFSAPLTPFLMPPRTSFALGTFASARQHPGTTSRSVYAPTPDYDLFDDSEFLT